MAATYIPRERDTLRVLSRLHAKRSKAARTIGPSGRTLPLALSQPPCRPTLRSLLRSRSLGGKLIKTEAIKGIRDWLIVTDFTHAHGFYVLLDSALCDLVYLVFKHRLAGETNLLHLCNQLFYSVVGMRHLVRISYGHEIYAFGSVS